MIKIKKDSELETKYGEPRTLIRLDHYIEKDDMWIIEYLEFEGRKYGKSYIGMITPFLKDNFQNKGY